MLFRCVATLSIKLYFAIDRNPHKSQADELNTGANGEVKYLDG